MNDDGKHSRINKYEKRRKTTKSISILLVIGSILTVIFIAMIIFGGKDNSESEDVAQQIEINEADQDAEESTEDASSDEEDINGEQPEEDEEDTNTDIEIESVPSDDDNVIKAFTGNWEPIGTVQEEPHDMVFQKDSDDWAEMEKAIRLATGLQEMTIHWLGNGGEQKAIGTVSSPDNTAIYRVYLSWVTNEGWMPTKVEELKEIDID